MLIAVLNPKSITTSGLASSRFARRYFGNLFWFLFLRLLRCFSSAGLPTYDYFIHHRLTEYCSAVFPHSDICGSMLICSSPQLFAAYHVLLRLLMPRHSPCALIRLTSSQLASLLICFRKFRLFRRLLLFPKNIVIDSIFREPYSLPIRIYEFSAFGVSLLNDHSFSLAILNYVSKLFSVICFIPVTLICISLYIRAFFLKKPDFFLLFSLFNSQTSLQPILMMVEK